MAEIKATLVTAFDGIMSSDDGAHALLKLRFNSKETVLAIQSDHLHSLLSLVCNGISQTAERQKRSEKAVFRPVRWEIGRGENGVLVIAFHLENGAQLAFQLNSDQIPNIRETLQAMGGSSTIPTTPKNKPN
jgi:hypothetical protein